MTWQQTKDAIEHEAVDIATRLAPWLADLPVAYLAGSNIIQVLRWPPVIGWAAALGVEMLGLSCVAVALEFRGYNSRKRKTDPAAPEPLAWGMVGVYFVSSLCLSLLATFTQLAMFAILVWPVMAGAATFVHALREDHYRRLEMVAADKAEDKAERQAAKAERERVRAESVQSVAETVTSCTPATVDAKPDTRTAVLDYLSAHPDAPNNEIVHELTADGYGRTAVYGAIHKVRQNGHAVPA